MSARPLRRLGFLTLGLFDEADPRGGHESTLQIIELGEQLGFDSAWLRHRHLQFGISSPVAVLGALSQRTSRIHLGTAVTPLGLENPFRLAEDLATVDVLSGGRLNPGFSTGTPMNYDHYKEALYPVSHELEDFSKARGERLISYLNGDPVTEFDGNVGFETFSRRIQPHSPTLVDRLWYGGGSPASAEWAGQRGLNLLTSSVIKVPDSWAEGDPVDFAAIQREQVDLFRSVHPDGEAARVSQGLVVIPTDSATPEQIARYEAYRDARLPRTSTAHGPARMTFSPDFVGPSEWIAEQLGNHAAFQVIDEVAFALPFTFGHEDYVQILTDMATRLGPALGWKPAQ